MAPRSRVKQRSMKCDSLQPAIWLKTDTKYAIVMLTIRRSAGKQKLPAQTQLGGGGYLVKWKRNMRFVQRSKIVLYEFAPYSPHYHPDLSRRFDRFWRIVRF